MASNVYSACSTITAGCFLFTDAGLTSPAPDGFYSGGSFCYFVAGGSGEVSFVSASCFDCFTYEVTGESFSIEWDNCDGSRGNVSNVSSWIVNCAREGSIEVVGGSVSSILEQGPCPA